MAVSRNSLTWISEWQFLPSIIVHSLSVHVYEAFLARCTSLWSQMSFAEHSILFVVSASTLSRKEVHDFSDLLTKLGESFHYIIFISKLVKDLLDHLSEFIKQSILEINQVLFICLVRHLMNQVRYVLLCIVSMRLVLSPEFRELILQFVDLVLIGSRISWLFKFSEFLFKITISFLECCETSL